MRGARTASALCSILLLPSRATVNFAHGPTQTLSSGAAHPAVGSFVAHVAFHVNKGARVSGLLEGETCKGFLDNSIDGAAGVNSLNKVCGKCERHR